MIILLDSGVLGNVINPTPRSESTKACISWFQDLRSQSILFGIPEICDYECRRELFQGSRSKSIERLNEFRCTDKLIYFPLKTDILDKAAKLWGEARKKGIVLADEKDLDVDVILIATAEDIIDKTGEKVVIATSDKGDLQNFNNEMLFSTKWEEITLDFYVACEIRKFVFSYGRFYE